MKYGSQNIDYALRSGAFDPVEVIDDYAESPKPEYTRKRSAKALRKRGHKRSTGASPGCGIGGRRNRQYNW